MDDTSSGMRGFRRPYFKRRANEAILDLRLHRRADHYRVRSRNSLDPSVGDRLQPRNKAAVVEAKRQLRTDRHLTTLADYDSDQIRTFAARGHEIDDLARTRFRLETSLKHQRVVSVGAGRPRRAVSRGNDPAAVILTAQQSSETRRGIETRPAQPINGAVDPYEGAGFQVAYECVVANRGRHAHSLRSK